ncbi:hypothetical protein BGZ73_000040 [Actinomortierella ambigua]|nr:hypothetical protein BGZ73_000040 [Actinomortierella ambigua]
MEWIAAIKKDIGGYTTTLQEIIDYMYMFLEEAVGKRKASCSEAPFKGIVITGRPGTGKTALATTLARTSGLPYKLIDCPDLFQTDEGASEAQLCSLFQTLQSSSKASFLILDEIDMLSERSAVKKGVEAKLFATLLNQIDSLNQNPEANKIPDIHFSDLYGLEGAIADLKVSVVEPFQHPGKYLDLGIAPPRGVLIHGPPGVGKTMLCCALAQELGINFMLVEGSQIRSKIVGESEQNIAKMFAQAKANAPCILFIDQIDVLAPARGTTVSSENSGDRIVTSLLTEMDGFFSGQSGSEAVVDVLVLAATNRPEVIDSAILRPGRLDQIVHVPVPSHDVRLQILKGFLSKMPTSLSQEQLDTLAAETEGFSGADLENLCREAALICLRENIHNGLFTHSTPVAMQEMKLGPSATKEQLLRPHTGQKMKLKEKFVEIYDQFLRGEDPSLGKDPEKFWDELFLIKVNTAYLSTSLCHMNEDQLLAIKDEINSIFLHAVQTMRDQLPQRRLHAIQTLTIVLSEIFMKKFHNWSFDVIHLLTGLPHADLVFKTLVQGICTNLDSENSAVLRAAALRLACALACGNDNVNKNSLNQYFMQKDIFPVVIQFIVDCDPPSLAFEAMSLLGILASYNKYETQNPYQASLASLDDPVILHKMVQVIIDSCNIMRRKYMDIFDDDEISTVSKVTNAISYLTGMLWNPKSQDGSATDALFAQQPDGHASILLLFYQLIYSNKSFLPVFLRYPGASDAAKNSDATGGTGASTNQQQSAGSESGLGTFLSFCSYLFHHNRVSRSAPYTHLCLIILSIIIESPSAYPYLCSIPTSEDNIGQAEAGTYAVRLCRQRHPLLPKVKQARPLAAVLLDVLLGFIKHNMRKKLPAESFRLVVANVYGLAHRFKRLRVRLRKRAYHWVEVWNTLLSLVKFMHSNIAVLEHRPDVRELVAETIDLVNYFVTYGDMIMPDPASIYSLFYEIVRTGIEPFSDLAAACRPVSPPSPYGRAMSPGQTGGSSYFGPSSHHAMDRTFSAGSASGPPQQIITIDLSNINTVFTFFFGHLLTWRDANPTRSMGPEFVTSMIKDHYQELTLVQIPLDPPVSSLAHNAAAAAANSASVVAGHARHPGWEAYSEVPGNMAFFRQLSRWVVADLRTMSEI